jgi:hypothetical protein
MSSAANPNPNNLVLLAVLGIGAFWMLTRRVGAQPMRPVNQQPGGANGGSMNGLGNVLSGLGRLFGGSGGSASGGAGRGPTSGTQQIWNDDVPGQPGYGWNYYNDGTAIGPDGTYYRDGQPIWSPSTDQIAFNPPGLESVYDNLYQG